MSIFVQENGPERIDFKKKLYGQLDELLPSDVIIASSSSGLTMSEIQSGCPVSPGALRHRASVQSAAPDPARRDCRRSEDVRRDDPARLRILHVDLGKRTVRLHKEVPGHVANRLQAALAREVYHLVGEGVVSVADVDTALCWGPGLRWGIMGKILLNHLGGGQGGIEHFLQQFTGPMTAWWKVLGSPQLTPELQQEADRQAFMPRWARARSTTWRRSETRSCWGCSSCAPRPRKRLRRREQPHASAKGKADLPARRRAVRTRTYDA